MNKKRIYAKPLLRKVRLQVSNSVLAACNTSFNNGPANVPEAGEGCVSNQCFTKTTP